MAVGVGPARDRAMATPRADHPPAAVDVAERYSRSTDSLSVGAAFQYIEDEDLRAPAIMKPSPSASGPDVPHVTKLNPARKRGAS